MKTPLFVSLFYILDYPVYKETLYSIMFEDNETQVEQWIKEESTFVVFQSYVQVLAPELDLRAINYTDWLRYVANNLRVISHLKEWIKEMESLEL